MITIALLLLTMLMKTIFDWLRCIWQSFLCVCPQKSSTVLYPSLCRNDAETTVWSTQRAKWWIQRSSRWAINYKNSTIWGTNSTNLFARFVPFSTSDCFNFNFQSLTIKKKLKKCCNKESMQHFVGLYWTVLLTTMCSNIFFIPNTHNLRELRVLYT